MPVTLHPASHDAQPWKGFKASSSDTLFKQSRPRDHRRSKRLIQSAFTTTDFTTTHIFGLEHGLVWSIYHAYSGHHHLTLRPEHIWLSILAQLQQYITAHAEELRSFFVSHEGQKTLVVDGIGTIDTVDVRQLAIQMTEQLQKNVKDPHLREWILPRFSTTTTNDLVVAAILMMGTLQKYFTYEMHMLCRIPSVTLLGDRHDWTLLLDKLEPICQLGDEPRQFVTLLRPVLKRFVDSFDSPDSPDVIRFWNRCAHQTGGSGAHYLSGWVTAFCFWDEDGRSLYKRFSGFKLDEVFYHQIDSSNVPAGVGSVPVLVNDNGTEYKTTMLAGLVGIQATGVDAIRPVAGWWMYEKEEDGVEEERNR